MATPPVFTAGSVLTAAQINAVGLWRMTGCTVSSSGGTAATASNGVIAVGTSNTSVTVNNAFTSDFRRYLIILDAIKASTGTVAVYMDLNGITGNTQYGSQAYMSASSGTVTGVNLGAMASCFCGWFGSQSSFIQIDGLDPNNTAGHSATTRGASYDSSNSLTWSGGIWSTSGTTFTGFKISPQTGSLTGGQIRVYGYNS